jgi:hypothetical protein
MKATKTDFDALEAIANGVDPREHLTRVTTPDESMEEFAERMNTALNVHRKEQLGQLIRVVNPTNYFDTEKPLIEQSPAPFMLMITMALTEAYNAGAAFVQDSIMKQLGPVFEAAKAAMAEEAEKSDG